MAASDVNIVTNSFIAADSKNEFMILSRLDKGEIKKQISPYCPNNNLRSKY